ncbi:nuclear-pore anchor [Selaginella moellendorffii]|uniref:nuclear-pore anchor n=1 Tax=Selaginella moellendorffii TaxID=88036 RepID=UPI000D1CECD9|nr:nuclear-pore anchor [Selaginella moellendorffii]|eukprot:XP_024540031.1 nuclear-pore anchor [Selaginella moellendorffii]
MPLFITDEELEQLGGDVAALCRKADDVFRNQQVQLETEKARADAARINAEQTCALVEQKYVALMDQVARLESEKAQLRLALENKSSEHAAAQARVHQLELELMKRDSDLETRKLEISELHKSRKTILDVVEKKNLELDEKNESSNQLLEKVLALTQEKSGLESRVHELMAELTRSRAQEARVTQEKDIFAEHNSWLAEELTTRSANLLEERNRNAQSEAELQAKNMEFERAAKEKEDALVRSQARVKDLETEKHGLIEELRFVKEDAAVKEEHLSIEVTTASKLAELYKQSSEEWSKKANDFEGVIKALEAHLNQTKEELEEQIQKEVTAREASEKELSTAKENFEKRILELQQVKSIDKGFLDLDADAGQLLLRHHNDSSEFHGVSGTALAATLLRDGWTLGTVYSKYQEATDAWRHERHERNRCQALLDRVLHEIEEKAALILGERAEYTRMLDAYGIMEEKLKLSMSDQAALENSVRELKAELRRKERDLKGATKDVSDLQSQVAVLLKECLDIQKRFGVGGDDSNMDEASTAGALVPDKSSSDAVISDKLLTFKDIHGLVEHNTKLRALARVLAEQNEKKEQELREEFESRLKGRIDEASEKVAIVLKRAEEQAQIIESLQGTVGMYKRLYEEERGIRSTFAVTPGARSLDGDGRDVRSLMETSHDECRRQLNAALEQMKTVEGELSQTRHSLTSARVECARFEAEATFAKEKLASMTRESESQRLQTNSILERNVELSQSVTDYQRRLRESTQNVKRAEDEARRLSIEVSVLEREKALLESAEKRASQEVSQLSDRVHRLQATLDTIETTNEVREGAWTAEKKKLEDDVNRMQREWVDAKHKLELERNYARSITSERDKAMERREALGLELKEALAALSASETRAKVAEVRSLELEANLRRADEKIMAVVAGGKQISGSEDMENNVLATLQHTREELETLREELLASRTHVEQYKNIAQANEEALKKMEEAHSKFKEEATKSKDIVDSELKILQKHLSEVESHSLEKEREDGQLNANREAELRNALKEVASLKNAEALKEGAIQQAEERIKVLKEDLRKEHQRWREAQNNYERQVLLQADTIRELSAVNEKLANLEQQENKYCEKAERAEAELESVKVTFFMEKASLEAHKADMEKRLQELDEQNRFLLDRLEAKHITSAEKDRRASTSADVGDENHEEPELQRVVQYLRRAKEAADTEISLLKQERVRLCKQFEAASRSAEEAQTKLRQHHENLRASVYTDEEFRALQAQVMETNILRGNNGQLQEEIKRVLDENKELQGRFQKLEEENESLKRTVTELQLELHARAQEVEVSKAETRRWEQRCTQMLEKYKSLDVDDYERVKALLVQTQERIGSETSMWRETIAKYEQELALRTETQAELERRFQDAVKLEASLRAEVERNRKILTQTKRKYEKDREVMQKEIEELKSGKLPVHQEALEACQRESALRLEQAQRENVARYELAQREAIEKDSRIQTLEKTLEKERDKSKSKIDKDRTALMELLQKATTEKQRFLEDLQAVKQENEQLRQLQQIQGAETSTTIINAEASSKTFSATVEQLNDMAAELTPAPVVAAPEHETSTTPPVVNVPPPAVLAPASAPAPAPTPTPTPPVPMHLSIVRPSVPFPRAVQRPPSAPILDDKLRAMQALRASIIEKEKFQTQTRRSGRRIIRPRMETSSQSESGAEAVESSLDAAGEGTSEAEGETARVPDAVVENDMNALVAIPMEIAVPAGHKRTSSESLDTETIQQQDSRSEVLPPLKKARNDEPATEPEVDAATTTAVEEPKLQELDEEQQELPSLEGADLAADIAAPQRRVRFSRPESLLDDFDGSGSKLKEKSPEPQLAQGSSSGTADEPVIEISEPKSPVMFEFQVDVEPEQKEATEVGEATTNETDNGMSLDVEDGEISLGTVEEAGTEGEFEMEDVKEQEELGKDAGDTPQETTSTEMAAETSFEQGEAAGMAEAERPNPGAVTGGVTTPPTGGGTPPAPAVTSTTINLNERARERAKERKRSAASPSSPETLRNRVVRAPKTNKGGRGRGGRGNQ